jgi:hypothetical protein
MTTKRKIKTTNPLRTGGYLLLKKVLKKAIMAL